MFRNRLTAFLIAASGAIGMVPMANAQSCAPAQVFAPEQITTPFLFESRLTFTPSRLTAYWSVTDEPAPPGSEVVSRIMTANKQSNGNWTLPQVASFSGVHSDMDPFVTPDGSTIFFSSSRPGGVEPNTVLNDIWMTKRTASGWGEPVNLGAAVNSASNELYPSADNAGNLYFASDRDRGQWDIYVSRRLGDGSYAPAENVGRGVNHPNRWEFNPDISPDGQVLLFATYGRPDSYGDVDIYVSYNVDGKFSRPDNMGPCINTAAPEFHPTVLWDRGEIYFVRVQDTTDFFTAPLRLP